MGGYWAHNPELMEKITVDNLPEIWADKVTSGKINLCQVPEDVRDEAFTSGEADYWGGQIDHAMLMKDDLVVSIQCGGF